MLTKINVLALCLLSHPVLADVSGRIEVIDGDTFRVGRETVRLFGIDAPEVAQTCQTRNNQTWACGEWVSAEVSKRYENKFARCTPLGSDRYRRVIAQCEVNGIDVGADLVETGLAFAYRKYSSMYDLAEKQAAVNNRGLHGSRVQEPAAYRAQRSKGRRAPDPNCAIKGNISSSGRIFHVPGQRDYDATGINLAKGERWFCSEQDARRAGWRKARR